MVVLILVVIVLSVVVVRLQNSLVALREEVADARLRARTEPWLTERLEAIERQVAALKEALLTRPGAASSAQPVAEPAPADEARLPHAVDTPPAVVEETSKPLTRSPAAPPVPAEPVPVSAPAPALVAEGPQEGWEVVVGTSWLNKIGVVVFVVGLALLLGYSMANVGPLGRVAMGFALSLGMLGTGVVLERRETYRNYAYGLMGGGWAGVYFTTYAMHGLPAALVIESELIGSLSLVLVAAGMIVHSLRYGSQTLTGLAYVSAYAPLAFSPLSTFSLAAAVPLAASLLVVSNRFAWSGVAVLGIASTYAIFILRTSAPDVTGDTTRLFLVLSTYWLLFEIADIAARRRISSPTADVPLFALNAVGLLGSLLLHTRADESQWLLIGAAAAAYSASALVRARFAAGATERADDVAATVFSTAHGATALAAALLAHAIDLRFSGTRETVALLVETQFLVAAGVTMADRHIRRIGTAVAIVTTAHLGAVLFVPLATTGFDSVLAASPTALLVAAAWHFNREWIQRRNLELDQLEYLYSWVALGLVLDVIAREVPGAYRGPMSLVWAGLLLEAGLRRAPEYRHQSFVAFAAGSCLTGAAFVVNPLVNVRGDQFDRDVWIALPAVIALAYGLGARAGRRATAVGQSMELRIAAAFAVTVGTGFLTVFEWHLAPNDALPAVWAATAAAATAFGVWRGGVVFRWHGYALAALATLLPLAGLAVDQVDSRQEYVSTIAVIAFLYIVGYIGRTVAAAPASLESVVAGFVAFLGSALQALFVWRVVPTDLVAPVWAVSATALVVMGGLRERPWQRWQAYGLVAIATLRTFVMFDVRALDTRLALASAAVVALSYLVGYLGRALRRPATASDDVEILAAGLLSYGASFHLAALLEELLPRSTEAAAWATAAVVLTAMGVWRARAGQRWQGYAFFWASIAWMLRDLAFLGDRDLPTFWMGFSILAAYATALAIRPALRAKANEAVRSSEEVVRVGLLIAATVVLSALLMNDVGTRLATLAWALQGAALLFVGFLARERVLRLSGLALLFVCILKLFAYDLQQLEALARILSFVVLGLVLLAVSWVYTAYREQIRKLL